MKIVIVGPGALGCLLANFLSKSKEEIWFLDKNKERASQMHHNGISIEGISGCWQIPVKATADTKEIGQADLIVICVKSYDTKEAAKQAKPLINENTRVLTLQN